MWKRKFVNNPNLLLEVKWNENSKQVIVHDSS